MNEAIFFESNNGKIFHAIFEDYFIVVELFNFQVSVSEHTGLNSRNLRFDRLIIEDSQVTKEKFQFAYDRAINKLIKLGF